MTGRIGYLSSSHKMVRETIGPGMPDKKTQGLIDIQERAAKAGFIIPEYACIKPAFFRRFLEDSGALKAKSHGEAENLILNHNFTQQEKEALRAAAMMFKPHEHGHMLVVRSGDQAEGLGIWSGGFAYAPANDEKRLFNMVEASAKGILASDFSEDAATYKGIKGISGNPGVILSPAYGECYEVSGTRFFRVPASVNFLGRQNGRGVYSFGPGLGGANNGDSPWLYGAGLSGLDSVDFTMCYSTTINMTDLGYSSERVRENEYYRREAQTAFNSKLDALMADGAQRYHEFVLDYAPGRAWVLTQSAEAKIPLLSRPSPHRGGTLAQTRHIIGTACVNTDKVYLSRYPGDDRLARFNAENSGYLLVILTYNLGGSPIAMGHPSIFDDHYSLRHFSNAGAVLIMCWDIMRNLSSHIGAAKRALGMPILAIESRDFENDVKKWGFNTVQPTAAKCLVYANEFSEKGPEGFIVRA